MPLPEPSNASELPPMTNANYVELGNGHCPFCRSGDTEAPRLRGVRGGDATLLLHCCACNRQWIEEYQLIGYRTLRG